MGAYYVFDFTRDEVSNGSYCSVKMDFFSPPGVIGANVPGAILHLVSVCERDVAIT